MVVFLFPSLMIRIFLGSQ